LQYGSGAAQGISVTDTMDFGGFSQQQTFVAVQQVSRGLLQGSISGLMGLGFELIAQTK
jgi:cathepsin D